MRRFAFALLLTAGCHKDSPVGTYDLAAPQAPPDLSTHAAATPLMTVDGKKVDLAAYRKKVTLLAMWGTFCEPCLKELPILEALHQKTKDDTDLAIVGIDTDQVASDGDRAHVADVAGRLKVTFPMLVDKDGVLAARFAHKDGDPAKAVPDGGAAGMDLPTTVLLLADGHYSRHSGFDDTVSPDSLVSDFMANIARAETGSLPTDDYDASPPPSDGKGGGVFKVILPAIPKADFAAKWPAIKADLKTKMHLSDKAIANAEAQLKTGSPAAVEITP